MIVVIQHCRRMLLRRLHPYFYVVKYFLLICFSLPAPLFAQILNIDKSDTADYSKGAKLSLNITSGLEIDKQKTTLYDASNAADLMLQKNHELYIVSGNYRFTYNGPDDFLNVGYIHLRYRHNYKNKVQPETFVQYNFDNTRGLLQRLLAGANYRYNFWKGDKFDFNAGLGLMYEHEKWNYSAVDSSKLPANTSPVINNLLKINSYVRFDCKTSANSDIAFSVFVQTRPRAFKPRIAPSAQWTLMAGKHLGAAASFTSIYDTSPVVPISRFYYSFTYSFLYKL